MPKESPELAGELAALSMTMLTLKAWDEAEPLLREALSPCTARPSPRSRSTLPHNAVQDCSIFSRL